MCKKCNGVEKFAFKNGFSLTQICLRCGSIASTPRILNFML